ncbi:MAG: amidase [Pseudomonadota bacterium]
MTRIPPYDPTHFTALTFHDRLRAFEAGQETPRSYLEACLETIDAREADVQAFASLNVEAARDAADASTARWADGRIRSPIDGMPIGIKDLLETVEMPTQMQCNALKGNHPKRDNAAVAALRMAGAVICGKTVTAELGGSHPGPTRNPFDLARTPGGSSSGSAAAVGARMLPAAIGSQVGGSIIRPASFCGNVALKPSQGAITRGERQATSQSTHGVHAGSIQDMWQVAVEIALRVGGDPGRRALKGPQKPPEAKKPGVLAVIETAGWPGLDDASVEAFDRILAQLRDLGVSLIDRRTEPGVEALERAIAEGGDVSNAITRWENRWTHRALADLGPDAISTRALANLELAEAMKPDDYEAALDARAAAQVAYAAIAPLCDGVLTLASPGSAPLFPDDVSGKPLAPRPTGDAIFNYPASMLFAPSIAVPLCAVGGLPLGVQVMGQMGSDAAMTEIAGWMLQQVQPAIL